MTTPTQSNSSVSFIVNCFDEFFKQVLKYKRLVLTKPWDQQDDKETSSPRATAEYILSKLETFLEEQALSATYVGSTYASTHYAEAQFVMIALGDEIFLNLDWPGKKYWENNLLEQHFYDTHSAGQTFFDKLDVLLENKDPAQIDIAILYLSALALGFQGKYRHFNGEAILASYRKQLFVFINRRNPYLFRKKTYLFPETYAYTLEGGIPKTLPTLRNWYFVFLGLGFTYLLASYSIWYTATADISRMVNRIITYNTITK